MACGCRLINLTREANYATAKVPFRLKGETLGRRGPAAIMPTSQALIVHIMLNTSIYMPAPGSRNPWHLGFYSKSLLLWLHDFPLIIALFPALVKISCSYTWFPTSILILLQFMISCSYSCFPAPNHEFLLLFRDFLLLLMKSSSYFTISCSYSCFRDFCFYSRSLASIHDLSLLFMISCYYAWFPAPIHDFLFLFSNSCSCSWFSPFLHHFLRHDSCSY